MSSETRKRKEGGIRWPRSNDPLKHLELPRDGGVVELEADTRVLSKNLSEFIKAGGTILCRGHKLFIDGTVDILDLDRVR